MKFIRKALWPTAIVAAALMLFGALGSAINADTLGDVQSSTGDNVVEAGEEVAIYVRSSPPMQTRPPPRRPLSTTLSPPSSPPTGQRLSPALQLLSPRHSKPSSQMILTTKRQPFGSADADAAADAFDYNGDGDELDTEPIFGSGDEQAQDSGLIAVLRDQVIDLVAADAQPQ